MFWSLQLALRAFPGPPAGDSAPAGGGDKDKGSLAEVEALEGPEQILRKGLAAMAGVAPQPASAARSEPARSHPG